MFRMSTRFWGAISRGPVRSQRGARSPRCCFTGLEGERPRTPSQTLFWLLGLVSDSASTYITVLTNSSGRYPYDAKLSATTFIRYGGAAQPIDISMPATNLLPLRSVVLFDNSKGFTT